MRLCIKNDTTFTPWLLTWAYKPRQFPKLHDIYSMYFWSDRRPDGYLKIVSILAVWYNLNYYNVAARLLWDYFIKQTHQSIPSIPEPNPSIVSATECPVRPRRLPEACDSAFLSDTTNIIIITRYNHDCSIKLTHQSIPPIPKPNPSFACSCRHRSAVRKFSRPTTGVSEGFLQIKFKKVQAREFRISLDVF